jgi:hypothetical protein
MSSFTEELRVVAAELDAPRPARARILLELGADLQAMRDALVARGVPAGEARRRALDTLLPAASSLAELARQHRPLYLRLLDCLSDTGRHRFERVVFVAAVLLVLVAGAIGLAGLHLMADPASATPLLLALGAGVVAVGLWKAFQLHVRRDHRLARLRHGLDLLPAAAVAAVVLSLGGVAVDFYGVAGTLEAAAVERAPILLAWLRRDAAMAVLGLLVGAVAIALWVWLSVGIARVEQAEADVLLSLESNGGES